MQTIITNRLMLRPFIKEDELAVTQILSHPNVMRYVLTGLPFSPEAASDFIQKHFREYEDTSFGFGVLCSREVGSVTSVLGFAGLLPFPWINNDEYEFGFVLAEHCWGYGYATEIARRLVGYAMQEVGMGRLFATVHPTNISSIAVLEKVRLKLYAENVNLTGIGRAIRHIYVT